MADLMQLEDEAMELDTIKDMFFIFEIDDEEYGIEVANVKEIISIFSGGKKITKVPQLPSFIEGIYSLRGVLIGVLDVRKRFGKEPKEYDDETCIVVVMYNQYTLGLIVDRVKAAHTIPPDSVAPPPSAKLNSYNQFIRNIGKTADGVKLLLDLEKFLEQ